MLALEPTKASFGAGEPVSLRLRTNAPAYVYCYARDAGGTLQRIFPNRFVADPRVGPGTPLLLPGTQDFRLTTPISVACVGAPRDVYLDVPAALRWGDFQALNAVRSFDEIQRVLEAVARQPVAMATLELKSR